jgi:hypothetical protein
MISFIVGLMIGAALGFFLACLCVAAGKELPDVEEDNDWSCH